MGVDERMQNKINERKTLRQILDESGISYQPKGWGGSMQLILNQEYVADVYVKSLEAKVEAANKILEELVIPYHIFTSQDDWLVKLRKCLSQEPIKKKGFEGLAEAMKKDSSLANEKSSELGEKSSVHKEDTRSGKP
jgi:hypothetical protein